MRQFLRSLSLLLLPLSAVMLIALQNKSAGFLLLGVGASLTLLCPKQFRNHLLIIYGALGVLGITPINTKIDLAHIFFMGSLLSSLLVIPYVLTRFFMRDQVIHFNFKGRFPKHRKAFAYLLLTAVLSYLMFPFLMKLTGSYHHWSVLPGFTNLFLLFLGTNFLGIWDELFFINTVLGILRRHLPFYQANLLQAVLFTSFLYELGFRGLFFIVIFGFALLQGYVFKKTASLAYIIAIHLIADFMLYLTLLHLHHPDWLKIFLT